MSYKELKSYQQATIIYHLTVEFCKRYLDPKSRTNDQMIQAARSGKQNIVEGTAASANNPKTEVFLLGVARASFEELLEDYRDFLRQKGFKVWEKDDPRVLEIRQLAYKNRSDRTDKTDRTNRSDRTDTSYEIYRAYLSSPEAIANVLATFINQTNFLLDQQIKAVSAQHQSRGVLSESQNQKAGRVLAERKKQEEEFNQLLQKYLSKKERDP